MKGVIIVGFSIVFVLSGVYINFIRKGRLIEKDLETTDPSLLLFRIVIPFCLLISNFSYFFVPLGVFHLDYSLYIGIILILLGLIIRWKAIDILGDAFQVNVSIVKNQQLITNGVYNKVRHPSYTGMVLYYTGLAFVIESYFALLLLVIGPIVVILWRIKLEEAFLMSYFGSKYSAYKKKSFKLIPYLY
jgi:protein-S-isoprenylcysteine O-methyltransferase Ste14